MVSYVRNCIISIDVNDMNWNDIHVLDIRIDDHRRATRYTHEIAEDRGIRYIKFGIVKYSTYNHRAIARVLRMKTTCKIKTVYVYSFAPKQ